MSQCKVCVVRVHCLTDCIESGTHGNLGIVTSGKNFIIHFLYTFLAVAFDVIRHRIEVGACAGAQW